MERPNAIIKRPTVAAVVANVIRQGIISAEFAGGALIRQEALAAELGVSRIPVREALLQREAEGHVIIHTHRCAEVARLTAEDAQDLFDGRRMIEPFVVEQTVAKLEEADIAGVAKALAGYEKGLQRRQTRRNSAG